MTRTRVVLASTMSCFVLLAGFIVSSIRSGQSQAHPALSQSTPPTNPPGASRQPFVDNLAFSMKASDTVSNANASTLTIPTGKNVVIEYATMYANTTSGQSITVALFVQGKTFGPNATQAPVYLHANDISYTNGQNHTLVGSQPLGFHVQGGGRLATQVYRAASDSGKTLTGSLSVIGYFE